MNSLVRKPVLCNTSTILMICLALAAVTVPPFCSTLITYVTIILSLCACFTADFSHIKLAITSHTARFSASLDTCNMVLK